MNICIFGASSNDIDQAYMDAVFNLGKKLAERGHTLVFGAGARGLMGLPPEEQVPETVRSLALHRHFLMWTASSMTNVQS